MVGQTEEGLWVGRPPRGSRNWRANRASSKAVTVTRKDGSEASPEIEPTQGL